MRLDFDFARAVSFKNESQRIRVLTEDWVARNAYCPQCDAMHLEAFPKNRPAADFFCGRCGAQYELKSKRAPFCRRVADGAYATMSRRVRACDAPHFFLLVYDAERLCVRDFSVVARQFFTTACIEPRKPLAASARRAGWAGCSIRLDKIPLAARVEIVKDGKVLNPADVRGRFLKTLFLDNAEIVKKKSWLLDVWRLCEGFGDNVFTLRDVYAHEGRLAREHPRNRNICAKIRQQLQCLRNRGVLGFLGNGTYRLLKN